MTGRLARIARWLGLRRPAPPRQLVVCAIIKDEGRHLLEWLAFHQAAGVEHFLLYDNGSTDDTAALTAAYERAFPGTVTLIPWPHADSQRTAYGDALRRLRAMTRWAAFIDADEFLFGVDEDLRDILRRFEWAACLCVYWMIYGSSGHVRAPSGLCIEAFTMRAKEQSKSNQHYKAIVQVAQARGYLSAHRPLVRGRTVDELGQDIDPTALGRSAYSSHHTLRINHYIVKSREEWEHKQRRGRPMGPEAVQRHRPDSYFADYDRNEREDLAALRLLPQVKRHLAAVDRGGL